MKLIRYLNNRSQMFSILLGFLLVLLIGLIDSLITPYISIAIFYIFPVALISWSAGKIPGSIISLASAITWFFTNISESNFHFHPAIHYWNTSVQLCFFLMTNYLLSELKETIEREKKLARTDHVTGAANRRFFYEFANYEICKHHRYRRYLTVAYIDIDNFKLINDNFGHSVGDHLLRVVTETINRNIRASDIIARLGGDEFAILLPETGYEASQAAIQRIQQCLLNAMQAHHWSATFSIGAITFLSPPHSVDELLERADTLMYSVKNNGKNRVEHITDSNPSLINKYERKKS